MTSKDDTDKSKGADHHTESAFPVISRPSTPVARNSPPQRESRTLRKISPLGFRVLVQIRNAQDVSDGGLYLPESAKSKMGESVLAEVKEVASAHDDDTHEDTNISGIPQGSTVLIAKDVGVRVPWDESLRIVDTKDILAIVDEVDIL